ncbi:dephospho-CoA kinase [Alkalilimnicola ehrlichii]|uniref:Dephospho-CoA kinase n=1 Tax=Alkalilimnicola ehrlichii TaxID=351052 RepID=A0A3E0WZV0_9GAMM|nr:dephospho-CoA kinase [Alkalilimnicola ehrlichii]RFA30335.1 dephospho-CoA kinase [Alkalilimnicola ehrlichii]RFA37909.1 dephospho-CoA kinase [Alkalilimnicola ehrlichii]
MRNPTSLYIVGLTGGVASGKSTVAELFAELGVPVLDADVAAREVVEPGTAGLARLVDTFGATIIDKHGRLDRRSLRNVVFQDQTARQQLEAILHPLIRQRLLDQLDQIQAAYVILVVPLLVESDFSKLVDRILVIDVPVETQRSRLMQRDACDRTQADAIIASQTERQRRLDAANDVLENSAGPNELKPKVEALHRHYLSLAAERNPG